MPHAHGVSTEERGLFVRFGLLGVLDTLTRQFAPRIAADYAAVGATIPSEFGVSGLSRYARSVVTRLLFALDQLQRTVAAREVEDWSSFDLAEQEKAGLFAESVLHSINAVAEVIGMSTLLALGALATHEVPPSFFGTARKVVGDAKAKTGALSNLQQAFQALDAAGSWHTTILARRSGLRQRVVHYSDSIQIQGSRAEGDDRWTLEAYLFKNYFGGHGFTPFFPALTAALADLCEWLDGFAPLLLTYFCARTGETRPNDPKWRIGTHGFVEPVEGGRAILESNFLFLPVCSDAGRLPERMEWSYEPGRINIK
jgi:hypothetical protein